jgi:anti-sigma B factor antagonist
MKRQCLKISIGGYTTVVAARSGGHVDRGYAWVTYHDDGPATIHGRGDLDMTTTGVLRRIVAEAVEHAGSYGVALDLSAVTFIDSVGLAALVAGFKATRARGLAFTVAAASPAATRLLQMTGLASLWGFAADTPATTPTVPSAGLAAAS